MLKLITFSYGTVIITTYLMVNNLPYRFNLGSLKRGIYYFIY